MTAEQLEELLGWYEQDEDLKRQQEGLGALQVLAPSLARRVIAAEKLAEALKNALSQDDDHWALCRAALTAYREASK